MKQDYSNWIAIIPARYASTRLPNKPLVNIAGKPLIVRVLENLEDLHSKGLNLVVATDSQKVLDVVETAGFQGVLTSESHENGTERCIEVTQNRSQPFILNIQGDEPFINTDDLCNFMTSFESANDSEMGTLVYPTDDQRIITDPSKIKVVATHSNHALYFSRSPIPYVRHDVRDSNSPQKVLHHIGVYAYQRSALVRYSDLPESPLESQEVLEQLRPLQAGWKISLHNASEIGFGIDTPDDVLKAEEKILEKK